jgi:hypothetical protein
MLQQRSDFLPLGQKEQQGQVRPEQVQQFSFDYLRVVFVL